MKEYSRTVLKEMFDGQRVSPMLPYTSLADNAEVAGLIAQGNGRISLSGVQPKYAMVVDKGVLRLAGEGERGTHILKPAPTATFILDRAYCPANEHLTMQMARQVYGIETAASALCYFQDGTAAYVTRRFDFDGAGGKYAQEDFAQLAGINRDNGGANYKYDLLSYEECGDLIRRYVKAAPVELLKFFRLVVFNYLVLNDDAHLKNFSLLERRPGDYLLSPAYDLMNTTLHLSTTGIFALQKGLFREGTPIDDTHSIGWDSFVEFGRRLGLSERIVDKEMARFAADNPLAATLIEESSLSESLKRHYLQSYQYRRHTLEQ